MAESTDEKLRAELQSLRIDPRERTRAPKPGRRKIWAGIAAAILLLAIGLFWAQNRSRSEPVEVAYATIAGAGGAGGGGLSGAGYVVTGDRYVSVGVRVPGRIEEYFIEEGQTVSRDAPLVRLDDRDYQAALQSAEAALSVARANLALAESELRRGEMLRNGNVLSGQEYDILANKSAVARATVSQLEAQVEQARVSLEYTTLRAPTDGVILAKLKEVGEIAVPGGFAGSGDLVRLANLNDMRAEVDVNEADLARVHLGGPAVVVPDAYPDAEFAARVVKLYPQVNRQKGTLRVEVQILDADERLLPDMSARVTFLEKKPEPDAAPSVWVPASAVRSEDDTDFVWRVAEGRASRVPVEVGARADGRVQITAGLSGGEAVVTSSAPLTQGQPVEP